jgi:hypothetical protein
VNAHVSDLSKETELLARRVADPRHAPVDTAMKEAPEATAITLLLEPDRPRERSHEAIAARRASVDKIVSEIAAIPDYDKRPVQEIADDLNAV